MSEVVYLAGPYSHKDPAVISKRMHEVYTYAAAQIQQGICVISPMYCHGMVEYFDMPGDWSFWGEFSHALLSRCDKMHVLMLDGWEESTGVQAEIKLAHEMNIPVEYIKVKQ